MNTDVRYGSAYGRLAIRCDRAEPSFEWSSFITSRYESPYEVIDLSLRIYGCATSQIHFQRTLHHACFLLFRAYLPKSSETLHQSPDLSPSFLHFQIQSSIRFARNDILVQVKLNDWCMYFTLQKSFRCRLQNLILCSCKLGGEICARDDMLVLISVGTFARELCLKCVRFGPFWQSASLWCEHSGMLILIYHWWLNRCTGRNLWWAICAVMPHLGKVDVGVRVSWKSLMASATRGGCGIKVVVFAWSIHGLYSSLHVDLDRVADVASMLDLEKPDCEDVVSGYISRLLVLVYRECESNWSELHFEYNSRWLHLRIVVMAKRFRYADDILEK